MLESEPPVVYAPGMQESPFLPVLKAYFGYSGFRPFQEEIMNRVVEKKDTLALLPTGGGKSLCYQVPALVFPGVTLVVSPLISLMKDQVQQLEAVGIPGVYFNSSLGTEEYFQAREKVRRGEVKLIYGAPETVLSPRFLELVGPLRVDCVTIDEAHCVSEWGHDFRPEYRRLGELRVMFPQAVFLALTATATPKVRQDIRRGLSMPGAGEIVGGFDRPNLHLEVKPKTQGRNQLREFIKQFPGQSGIVYCSSRKQVEELTDHLDGAGLRVRPYHAGLSDQARSLHQDLFLKDDVDIIVATIAFGMGINKSNVRFVCHYDLPKSLESYYQEIGRAGRDGLDAHCLLLYSYGDAAKQEYFFKDKYGDELAAAKAQLKTMVDWAEEGQCRRIGLLRYFGETFPLPPGGCRTCDNCKTPPEDHQDLTVPAQKFLSCVIRTGQRFGAGYIAQVLLGSDLPMISDRGHRGLSTFGIGKEWTEDQWRDFARNLESRGLLARDEHQGLHLTSAGGEFLKTKSTFYARAPKIREKSQKKSPRKKALVDVTTGDEGLFQVLRGIRKRIADEEGVPPFVVFSDKTLKEMSTSRPRGPDQLMEVSGVGTKKLQVYGQTFLKAISDYVDDV